MKITIMINAIRTKKTKMFIGKKIHNNTIDEIINKNGCSINIDISDENRGKNSKEDKIENTSDTRKKLKGKEIKKRNLDATNNNQFPHTKEGKNVGGEDGRKVSGTKGEK